MAKARMDGGGIGPKYKLLLLLWTLPALALVGGTVAWLTAQTPQVENVFTVSKVDVLLEESRAEYTMIPGWTVDKDPTALVLPESEDCYLFLHVEQTGGGVTVGEKTYSFSDFLVYQLERSWLALDVAAYPGVYYKVIDHPDQKGVPHKILTGGSYTDPEGTVYTWASDQLLTKPEVTRQMMEAVKGDLPTLSFTLYGVQLWKTNKPASGEGTDGQFTPVEAWRKVSPGM